MNKITKYFTAYSASDDDDAAAKDVPNIGDLFSILWPLDRSNYPVSVAAVNSDVMMRIYLYDGDTETIDLSQEL